MKKLITANVPNRTHYPVKVLQFGEGNFLRGFVDWIIQKANNSLNLAIGVVVVQPLANGMVDAINAQNGLYHVILEGVKDSKPIRETTLIDCVMDAINPYAAYQQYEDYFLLPSLEFIISNTTEAGICRIANEDIFATPPVSFPGKITSLLFKRFQKFEGCSTKGLHLICCELIENNATILKEIVLELASAQQLGDDFIAWLHQACSFNNSLVDRIVTGFPKDKILDIQAEIGFEDNLVVVGEYFHLWAIEGGPALKQKLPLHNAGLNVLWLDDLKSFRDKKVRVLNGSHTALVPVGLLLGQTTVKEAFDDKLVSNFIRNMVAQEILPTIKGNSIDLQLFADEILERFLNPYIRHFLKDISLNSISKWMTRNYPSLLDFKQNTGALPSRLTFSLAALLVLYTDDNKLNFCANDTKVHLDFMNDIWKTDVSLQRKVEQIISNSSVWGVNLSQIDGLVELLTIDMGLILEDGMLKALKSIQ